MCLSSRRTAAFSPGHRRSLYSIYRRLQSSSRHLVRRRRRWLFDVPLPLSRANRPTRQTALQPSPAGCLASSPTICTVIDTPLNFGEASFPRICAPLAARAAVHTWPTKKNALSWAKRLLVQRFRVVFSTKGYRLTRETNGSLCSPWSKRSYRW